MAFHIGPAEIISAAALLLSGYSTIKTISFNKRQKEFIDTNDKLNRLLLDREQQESLFQKQADISANFIQIGRNHRLKVFNKGKTTATNVRIEFPDGNEILIDSDVKGKFPMPTLEPYQSVELLAAVHMGSPPRMAIKFIWDDPSGNNREKVQTVPL
jgi:hypothetical protein